jgi:hypothetical protein
VHVLDVGRAVTLTLKELLPGPSYLKGYHVYNVSAIYVSLQDASVKMGFKKTRGKAIEPLANGEYEQMTKIV